MIDYSLNPQSANLIPNDSEVRNPSYQRTPKIDFKPLSNSQQYNLHHPADRFWSFMGTLKDR